MDLSYRNFEPFTEHVIAHPLLDSTGFRLRVSVLGPPGWTQRPFEITPLSPHWCVMLLEGIHVAERRYLNARSEANAGSQSGGVRLGEKTFGPPDSTEISEIQA